jgi:peptide/nickel transport system substrate-binding protein
LVRGVGVNAKRNARALALVAVASLIVSACTIEGPAAVKATARAPTTRFLPSQPPTPTDGAHGGGDVTFGAESWPKCLNPITACADNAWTYYTVLEHVLPRAMQLDPKGNFVLSPLLVEAPSLNTGDLSQSPFTVTFKIRPEAVWDDGSPITSADFDFTWRAILLTPGAIRTAGYRQIEYIDATDPKVAVIGFKTPYADWQDLFGGAFGFILKESAFSGQVGLFSSFKFAMLESIPFSGGPFILKSWTKDKAVLVRNDNYFARHANLGSVTFIPLLNQDLELQTFLAGKVSALYVDSIDPEFLAYLGPPEDRVLGSRGTDYEALWFDRSIAPLDDPQVREALMYAIDRQGIIDEVVRNLDPDSKVLNCGFVTLPDRPWCQTIPFALFNYDPEKAKSILRDDGYDCSPTPCTKNGEPLQVGLGILSKSWGRTTTRDLIIAGALEAGFELRSPTSTLTAAIRDLPARTSPDPSVTDIFACDESNSPGNLNFSHWCDPAAQLLMKEGDEELDPARRLELLNHVYSLETTDFIGLPLYLVPKITFWRTDQIDGPVHEYSSSAYGLFFNMNEWYAVSG